MGVLVRIEVRDFDSRRKELSNLSGDFFSTESLPAARATTSSGTLAGSGECGGNIERPPISTT